VGRNLSLLRAARFEAAAAKLEEQSRTEAVFCFAVASSAHLRSNTLFAFLPAHGWGLLRRRVKASGASKRLAEDARLFA
jgi:hypothetical protein